METFNKNTVIISIVSVIAIFAFLFLVYSATNKSSTSDVVHKEVTSVSKDDHITWSPSKKHLLVEYGDFQCPACKAYHTILKTQIEASGSGMPEVTKNITFVFRDFPLTNIHQHAMEAVQAAEAAGRQNKFYEYGDILFDKQEEWAALPSATDYFMKIAKQLKLDEKKFKADMNSAGVKNKIDSDLSSGTAADVQGTPTFFLDGKKLEDISSFDDFKKILSDTAKK